MAHPYHHAISSAKKFGGKPEDYQALHDFMDSSKQTYADWRHRAILHSSFGIFIAEKVFGTTITNSTGKAVPVRLIAEQHVREDLGWIPTPKDWLSGLKCTDATKWMTRGVDKTIVGLEEIPNETIR